MESFGKDKVNMYYGDGFNMLSTVVPHKSADIAIVDNPFKLELAKKQWMYAAVASVLKDDGIMIIFDDERGWEQTVPALNGYFHVVGRTILWKGRPMRKTGEAKSNKTLMNWLLPSINPLIDSGKEWQMQYLANKPLTKDNRISEIWYYNSSDKLGLAAKVSKPHRGAKGIGMAGFLLSHMAGILKRDNITVVDPYAGSGTFAIASQLLGMQCYSSEIDQQTFEDAKIKFMYSLDKAKEDKYWFKSAITEFQNKIVGPEKSTVSRPRRKSVNNGRSKS